MTFGKPKIRYRSSFRNWHVNSSVRSRPRRLLAVGTAENNIYFSRDLVPVSCHELVRRAGLSEIALIYHLFRYLDFTTILENMTVNPVTMGIALGRDNLDLPADLRSDAYKIYCDEAYHALFSVDLKHQVEQMTGFSASVTRIPDYVDTLDRARQSTDAVDRGLVDLMFVIVSETLITGILSRVPGDEFVSTVVRDVIRDHAVDEGLHSIFFSTIMQIIWPQLSRAQRRHFGMLLPEFICAFLKPDFVAMDIDLASCGLDKDQRHSVILGSYPQNEITEMRRRGASDTISLLKRCGAIDDPEIRRHFTRCELLTI